MKDKDSTATDLPKITLVTPSYNTGAFLEHTIQSVLAQSYPNLEYIVVDGASTDNTRQILSRYAHHLSKLIVEPDCGHGDALRKGFAAGTGQIMGWLNADDLMMPGALDLVARVFGQFEYVNWIQGNHTLLTEQGTVTRSQIARPMSRPRMLMGDYRWVQQESTFWTRRLWEVSGSVLGHRAEVAIDLELWLRFFRYTRLYNVEGAIGAFRRRKGQRSSVLSHAYQHEVEVLLAQELDILSDKYRAMYADALPKVPRTLSQAEVGALPEKIFQEDLAPIRYDDDGRLHDPNPAQTRRPIAGASHVRRFSHMRNRHRGERLVVMGNGPSLNQTPLELLQNETVFACNACFLLFDRIDWRPVYYTCVDTRVLPDRAPDIRAMHEAHPEMVCFFPETLRSYDGSGRVTRTRDLISDATNRYFFSDRAQTPARGADGLFSSDMDRGLILPETVTITMLQIACHLGFSEIYLIGCDTAYRIQPSVSQDGPKTSHGERLCLTSTLDDDPNHFDPRYFGRGRTWHNPKVPEMIRHYREAREVLNANGVAVYNATVGGALEVFPRRDLHSVF